MHHPIIDFNYWGLPIYLIMAVIGIVAALFHIHAAENRIGCNKDIKRRINGSLWIALAISLIISNITNWFLFPETLAYSLRERILYGGLTYYFGMLPFIGVSMLLWRLRRLDYKYWLDQIIPVILIFHFFARIGCSLAGCCYGKTIIIFDRSIMFPARELEALLALILYFVFTKKIKQNRVFWYLLIYSVTRFFLEFMRADPRGRLLTDWLSPSQVISIFIWFGLLAYFLINKYVRPRLATSRTGADVPSQGLRPASQVGHVLRIIRNIALAIAAVIIIFSLINPFNMVWCDSVAQPFRSIMADLQSERSSVSTIGDSNGTTVLRTEDPEVVGGEEDALELIGEFDEHLNIQYKYMETEDLPDGGRAHILAQSFNDLPIEGTGRVIITDSSNNVRYITGEATSVPDELATGSEQNNPGMSRLNLTYAISQIEYASGPFLNLPDQDYQQIIETEVQDKSDDHEHTDLQFDEKAHFNDYITDITDSNRLTYNSDILKRVYADILERNILTVQDFKLVLESSLIIATNTSNMNYPLYRDIFMSEVNNYLSNQDISRRAAKRITRAIEQAFANAGIVKIKDEEARLVEYNDTAARLDGEIVFADDADTIVVRASGNQTIDVAIETQAPVQVTIMKTSGELIVSMPVEESENIPVYAQSDESVILNVSAVSWQEYDHNKPVKYNVKIDNIDQKVDSPDFIQAKIQRIMQAYNDSSANNLARLSKPSENSPYEMLLMSLMTKGMNSCMNTLGQEDLFDADKALIAGVIMPRDSFDEQYKLKNTTLNLTYIDHLEQTDRTLVKARFEIMTGSLVLLEGFTYFDLESDRAHDEQAADNQIVTMVKSVVSAVTERYYITDFNLPEYIDAFGDNLTLIQSNTKITSLYEHLTSYEENYDGYTIELQKFEYAQAAATGQYSTAELESFVEFNKRYNLSQYKAAISHLELTNELYENLPDIMLVGKDIYDIATDPVGYLIGATIEATDNQLIQDLYSLTDLEGLAYEMVVESLREVLPEFIAENNRIIALLKAGLAEFEADSVLKLGFRQYHFEHICAA